MHKRTKLGIILLSFPIFIAILGIVFFSLVDSGGAGVGLAILISSALEIFMCCPSVLLLISGNKKSSAIKQADSENPDFVGFVSEGALDSKKTKKRGSKQKSGKKEKKKKDKSNKGDVEFTF
ncbi:hypothetical protein ES708_28913 [subsurface metagenome]